MPRGMSSVPAVMNVIGVRWSKTMSVTSPASRRTAASPADPAVTSTVSPAIDSVQAPSGVSTVKGVIPSSSAPGTARYERSEANVGSWFSKRSTMSTATTSSS